MNARWRHRHVVASLGSKVFRMYIKGVQFDFAVLISAEQALFFVWVL